MTNTKIFAAVLLGGLAMTSLAWAQAMDTAVPAAGKSPAKPAKRKVKTVHRQADTPSGGGGAPLSTNVPSTDFSKISPSDPDEADGAGSGRPRPMLGGGLRPGMNMGF
jgi:hypothetical protein